MVLKCWKNKRNVLYHRPNDKVMSLVKVEKRDRSVFRAKLKETKLAGMKERLESIAYFDDNGNEEIMAENDKEKERTNTCDDNLVK